MSDREILDKYVDLQEILFAIFRKDTSHGYVI